MFEKNEYWELSKRDSLVCINIRPVVTSIQVLDSPKMSEHYSPPTYITVMGDEKKSRVGSTESTAPIYISWTQGQARVLLIPQPGDDSRDPLNWPFAKKGRILAVGCIASFSALAAPLADQINLVQQSKIYHKKPSETCGWWTRNDPTGLEATKMTKLTDYRGYLASRFVAGFFGTVTIQAFTAFYIALDFGFILSPTFAGFVAANADWPVEYWWSIAMVAFSALLVLLILEETKFNRASPDPVSYATCYHTT
ncbi:uncharacterized protein BDR25DRAFT_348974 [Lindgomyces ingoldianus]|uniref:Uncharacterized protein n=1 Tax=Lindgomyces ingoldianus TaxID=673940 RepID=A0ACB6RFH5_9PLEO|nr:uncharacterized protein BDR25DRAFT_348974 [Lindgomyces ingoldianus]KAF2477082.1 hypothetical protein BDR25DRAFT_348974 [Lindgomyces ingoldianus]